MICLVSSIPTYFQNTETPIICFKYNKPVGSINFNFDKLLSDLDTDTNTPETWDCKDLVYCYPTAGHIITGILKIIPDSRIRNIISKGLKYQFPSNIDFNTYREEIAAALNEFGNWWCKQEYVEHAALKEWKLSILRIVKKCIAFYCQNTNLLPPKPKRSL